jgi:hypothetical protein
MTNSNITPLRAIDMPATENNNAINQWFFTDNAMRAFLCHNWAYAHEDGTIRNHDDNIIGIWYYAELSAKSPNERYNEAIDAADVDLSTIGYFEYSHGDEWGESVGEYIVSDHAAR